MRTVCCICKRFKIDEEWVEQLNVDQDEFTASHGYCPECFILAMEAVKTEMAKGRTWQSLKIHGLDSRA